MFIVGEILNKIVNGAGVMMGFLVFLGGTMFFLGISFTSLVEKLRRETKSLLKSVLHFSFLLTHHS